MPTVRVKEIAVCAFHTQIALTEMSGRLVRIMKLDRGHILCAVDVSGSHRPHPCLEKALWLISEAGETR